MSNSVESRTPLIGVGLRPAMRDWALSQPPELDCLELTAEHFFDTGKDLIGELRQSYPLYVHGLGLSLGSPGPLDERTLSQFAAVVEIANPEFISEHIAFTRSDDVDLGHLNPLPTNQQSLTTVADHARELSDRCGKPVVLENITRHLSIGGDMDEPEFLNELCERAECGLLLDVTNLLINARNHNFDHLRWLDQLDASHVRQVHIVGYSEVDGRLHDRHAESIQEDLLDLLTTVVARSPLSSIIIERDVNIPSHSELANELTRVRQRLQHAN